MFKVARGTLKFEYALTEHKEALEGLDELATLRYFAECMVDDIIDMAYSDLSPAIEMEIVNVG